MKVSDNTIDTPSVYGVKRVERESASVVSLTITMPKHFSMSPGQFNMLYAFGLGEVPISVSRILPNSCVVHTIRAVGSVTKRLCALRKTYSLGVRGPFGTSWPMSHLENKSVMIVAGGIGLAPLRPVLDTLAEANHPNVKVYIGARTAEDILFQEDIAYWRTLPGWIVEVTVDKYTPGWTGHVGVVTQLLKPGQYNSTNTIVLTCGPEIMMRYVIQTCESLGIEDDQIYISMERNMQCGMGLCGHCQWGGYFICKEGPVFRFDLIRSLFYRRDL